MIKGLKRFMLVVGLVLVLVGSGWAQSATLHKADNANTFSGIVTFTTVTTGVAVGPGVTNVTSFGVPMSNFSCSLLYTGVGPTTSTYTLQGSIDKSLWRDLSSGITTTLATGNYTDSTGKWVNHIRGNWSVLTKGAGTTTATMKCNSRQ